MNNIKRATIGTTKGTKTGKQVVGKLGEDIACTFLVKHGFSVLERNYLRKCGELDIIAERHSKLHFIEVKAVKAKLTHKEGDNVSCETLRASDSVYDPAENLTTKKLQRLKRTIAVYLAEKKVPTDREWSSDAVIVLIDMQKHISRVSFIKDIFSE